MCKGKYETHHNMHLHLHGIRMYVCWMNIFLNIQQFYSSMKNDRKFNCYPKTSKLIAVACHQGNQ